MLNILGQSTHLCNGLSRRAILTAGGAGLFGLQVPSLLSAENKGEIRPDAKAKSVLFIFLFGQCLKGLPLI